MQTEVTEFDRGIEGSISMTRGVTPRRGRQAKVERLDDLSLARGVRHLSRVDSDLARVIERFGPPPMWERDPDFSTLLRIILEQQVSLASAKAAFDKLCLIASPLDPQRFLELDDVTLKGAGFSRQKTRYGRDLAERLVQGRLDLAGLRGMDDDSVRAQLMSVKGIGLWSADIYLLMAMLRPDVWPRGDLALATAVQKVKRLRMRPDQGKLDEMSEAWRPWRAVAARLFWHFYVSSG
jgi:DNA-3-methyladenine glycosylase II